MKDWKSRKATKKTDEMELPLAPLMFRAMRDLICEEQDDNDSCDKCPLRDVHCGPDDMQRNTEAQEILLQIFTKPSEKTGIGEKRKCPSFAPESPRTATEAKTGMVYRAGINKGLRNDSSAKTCKPYPQETEEDEYRYIDAGWLEAVARGLTAGARKHPGETWRQIPTEEHIARAMRHLNLQRAGDRKDNHLINAAMRCMMAYATERARGEGTR